MTNETQRPYLIQRFSGNPAYWQTVAMRDDVEVARRDALKLAAHTGFKYRIVQENEPDNV